MSKITNDGLTRSVTGCFIAVVLYPYGNSGRQRVILASQLAPTCNFVCNVFQPSRYYIIRPYTTSVVNWSLSHVLCTDYRRSASAMAIICMCLFPMSIAFGLYAVRQARYMYKRVASAVHLVNGG